MTTNTQGDSWEERFKADWDSGTLSWNGNLKNGISYQRIKDLIAKERTEGERRGEERIAQGILSALQKYYYTHGAGGAYDKVRDQLETFLRVRTLPTDSAEEITNKD